MRSNLLPVTLGLMALVGAVTIAILNANGRLVGKTSLLPYLYGVCFLLFASAFSLAIKQSGRDQRKPRVVPLRYGSFNEGVHKINGRWHKADGTPFTVEEVLIGQHVGKHGLFVKNDGEPAYDLAVSGALVGTSKLTFETDKPRLASDEGEVFFGAWIETSPHNTIMGNGLFDEMRSNNVPSIEITLTYKDEENRWFKTICKIERDVLAHGGLNVRYVCQERAKAPKVSS